MRIGTNFSQIVFVSAVFVRKVVVVVMNVCPTKKLLTLTALAPFNGPQIFARVGASIGRLWNQLFDSARLF